MKKANMGNKYFIIAGEHSGDLHASNLIEKIKERDPSAAFIGAGGALMKNAGVKLLFDLTSVSVVGFFEVCKHYFLFRKVFSMLLKAVKDEKPDLIILIDYPGFNMMFARSAKRLSAKILYYISPQVWAWKKDRVQKMAKIADKLIVIFPFEKKYYAQTGLDVEFVGHPLVDIMQTSCKKEEFFKNIGLNEEKKLIGILPGSRENEVRKLLPEIMKAIPLLKKSCGIEQFVIGCASSNLEPIIKNEINKHDIKVVVVRDMAFDVMKHSDFAIVSSGTATLQTGFFSTPMVIIYKVSWITYFLGKHLIKIPCIGLANVVLGEKVVPELLQNDVNGLNIARETEKIIKDVALFNDITGKLAKIEGLLGNPGASKRAADIAIKMAAG
ncbi:MAG: lipid-A-disaccharide synthase [Candidatus Aureabacteria bacterium]|nr:lipid-A-disaccharide synthase [Candidatus Auribacterota bacterium]